MVNLQEPQILHVLCLFLVISQCSGRLITRQEWGAEAPEDPQKIPEPVPYVAIHHTYIPGHCPNTEACKKAMKSMQNYHKNELHWGDIGYSFCIGGDGNIYEGRGWGIEGAHTIGWNSNSIGVCFIGDSREVLPSSQMLKSLDELRKLGISNGHLSTKVKYFGHRQVGMTACPGKALYEYIKNLPQWTPNPQK